MKSFRILFAEAWAFLTGLLAVKDRTDPFGWCQACGSRRLLNSAKCIWCLSDSRASEKKPDVSDRPPL